MLWNFVGNELCENLRAGSEATSELASPSDPKEA